MNLTSKKIQVVTRKINTICTREMISDLIKLKSLDSMFYEYRYDNVDETLIIEKYFIVDYIEGDYIYYIMTEKTLRKIKLLVISQSDISEILRKIIKESVYSSVSEALERRLSRELASQIDREILKTLMSDYVNS